MIDLYHWEPNGVFLKPLMALEEKQAAYTSHWFDPTRFEQIAAVFPSSVESQLQLEREGPVLVADGDDHLEHVLHARVPRRGAARAVAAARGAL
jgi:hypothetical protein